MWDKVFRNNNIDELKAEVSSLKETVSYLKKKLYENERGFKSEVKSLKDESWKLKQRLDSIECKGLVAYKNKEDIARAKQDAENKIPGDRVSYRTID